MSKIKVTKSNIPITYSLYFSEVAKAKLLHKIVLLVKTLSASKICKPMSVKSIPLTYNTKLIIYPQKTTFMNPDVIFQVEAFKNLQFPNVKISNIVINSINQSQFAIAN